MPEPFDVIKALNELAKKQVLIGVPSEKDPRDDGGPIGNAALAYIHETGSPAMNIPARPFLHPGIEESRPQWEPFLRQAAAAALAGNHSAVDNALHEAGQIAVGAAKDKISAGIPPPITPASMAARARYRNKRMTGEDEFGQPKPLTKAQQRRIAAENRKRAGKRAAYRGFYERYEHGVETRVLAGGVTPLYDTGQLVNSLTYVIRIRG